MSAEARREQLIEAAGRVIAREGADGATTRKIVDEAKAPLASLHYCFQNNENLLLAVFEQLSDELPVDVDLPEGEGASPGRVIEQCLTRAMRWSVENPVRMRAMIGATLWAARAAPSFPSASTTPSSSRRRPSCAGSTYCSRTRSSTRCCGSRYRMVDGLSLQMLTNGDKERTLRDAATACATLKAFLDESARKADAVGDSVIA
ncbi:TetR family transcriptional regulator [Streptomyces sp. NPDC051320]|uniref:TetR/AcrR family transcriptional regulator n=1 Tax=Streptomyces sp. NPDC051320 TaxID=3154644 RepID=UPI0034186B7E